MTPEQFDQEFGPEFTEQTSPYGYTAQPVKPGLTKRGKVAITVAAMAVAGTGFFWYQSHSAQVAADTIKAQELQYKQDLLELEKLKEINKVTAAQKKQQAAQNATQQKFVDACIQADKGLVGKQMGVTYSSVVADCQAQFQGGQDQSVTGADMAVAGSADEAGSTGGGINSAGLVGIAVGGGLLVALGARRMKKTHTQ